MAVVGLSRKRRIVKQFFILICVFLLGFISDRVLNTGFTSATLFAPIRQIGYSYVSPLLYCRYPNTGNSKLISSLYTELHGYTGETNAKGITQNVSVYFHDPTNGEWMSVNGSDQYAIASLVKVPLFMMLYQQSETNPNLLAKKLRFDGSVDDAVQNFKPPQQDVLHQGQSYTVDDLISRMIMYSDNNAMDILTSQIKLDQFNGHLKRLDFSPIQGNSQDDINMTVGKYATFFRVLYNATYLDPAMSEKALKLLTKTTFDSGIVAGVPKNIQVAHKFGERAYDNNMTKELHDCGIVYYPKHPYILCVMTKGNDFNQLASVIQTISLDTYNAVNASYH